MSGPRRSLLLDVIRALPLLFRTPRIVKIERLRANLALSGGLVPVRVVAKGAGVLRVGQGPWIVALGDVDTVLFTPAEEWVTVVIRTLVGSDARPIVLGPLVKPAPGRIRVSASHDVAGAPAYPRDVVHVAIPTAPRPAPLGQSGRLSRVPAPRPRAVPRSVLPVGRPYLSAARLRPVRTRVDLPHVRRGDQR